eukprot:CAMPEP_0172191318 /NCGR_PEP_ID=MMETSP1050-20130122/23632_1 /TAXON_ID=233186 /ORGANISM="Cryptomonas curvata, Strain CCAP979/52" /LENGTH=129 /DNA_ID=CAMNT_0012866349 /DNA_START=138 /DNA_END=523 /DNA_ORIENTATION=+
MAMNPGTVVEKISNSAVGGLALCCERREVYTTYDERSIRVWNTDDGRLLRTFENAHGGNITSLVWLPQRILASCSLDHCLSVWSPKGEIIARAKVSCSLFCCGYSAKHDFLVVGGNRLMFVMQLKRDEA